MNLRRFCQPLFSCEKVNADGVVMGAWAKSPASLVGREYVALDEQSESAVSERRVSPGVDKSVFGRNSSIVSAAAERSAVVEKVVVGGLKQDDDDDDDDRDGTLVVLLKKRLPPKVCVCVCMGLFVLLTVCVCADSLGFNFLEFDSTREVGSSRILELCGHFHCGLSIGVKRSSFGVAHINTAQCLSGGRSKCFGGHLVFFF